MVAHDFNGVVLSRDDITPDLSIIRVAPMGWDHPQFRAGQFTVLGLPASAPRLAGCELPPPPAPENPAQGSVGASPDDANLENTNSPNTAAAGSAVSNAASSAAHGGWILRSYSIASSPLDTGAFEFYLALVRTGALTPRLFALQTGDPLYIGAKTTGMFTLQEVPPTTRHVLLISTGTGLAPYIAMLRTQFAAVAAGGGGADSIGAAHLPDARYVVLHGVREPQDLGYRAELGALAAAHPDRVTYLPVVSRPQDSGEAWTGPVGHVSALFHDGTVRDALGGESIAPETTHAFLCGNPAMITGMTDYLQNLGLTAHSRKTPGQIHTESYW